MKKLQIIQNIKNVIFQVIFIFFDWILIKQIIVSSTLFWCCGKQIFERILPGVMQGSTNCVQAHHRARNVHENSFLCARIYLHVNQSKHFKVALRCYLRNYLYVCKQINVSTIRYDIRNLFQLRSLLWLYLMLWSTCENNVSNTHLYYTARYKRFTIHCCSLWMITKIQC